MVAVPIALYVITQVVEVEEDTEAIEALLLVHEPTLGTEAPDGKKEPAVKVIVIPGKSPEEVELDVSEKLVTTVPSVCCPA
jgi:hypothetical protein